MARLVRHEQTGPIKIDPATWPRDAQGNLKPIFVCACGLSSKFPFCDGTHKGCNEEPGMVYRYDPVTKAVLDATQEA
ncbi:MAG: CDGSH iron-sulfur domain-containing protein [Planctomycetes bacterium]|nr:CDGSH iron-sulfur domain-containing protein [Planctomycetota bacterium]